MPIFGARVWLVTGLSLWVCAGAALSAALSGGIPQPDCVNGVRQTIESGGTNGVSSIFAIDLDGDDDADVLSASANDDTIAWYQNDGNDPPAFTRFVISTNADGASSVFAADLDDDGDVDVISASANDDTIAWYENKGGNRPVFIERVILTNADQALAVHARDLDGDGDTDILSASFSDSKIAACLSNRLDDPLNPTTPPGFSELIIAQTALGAAAVHTDFIDDDSRVDVLSASRLDDRVAWYRNLGFVCNDLETQCSDDDDDQTCVSACEADCKGDANCESACGTEACRFRFQTNTITATAKGATAVHSADVDGDLDTDVLSASSGDNRIAWYEQTQVDDGEGGLKPAFTKRIISAKAKGASSVFAVDLDDDNDIDVLSASRLDGKIAWYENLGGGNFGNPDTNQQILTIDAPGAASVFAIDRDGTPGGGDIDVVAGSSVAGTIASDDKIVMHRTDGLLPPSFTEALVSGGAIAPRALLAVDVDSDAGMDIDVIAANGVDDSIVWFENDGFDPPAFTRRILSTDAPQAVSLFWANLDGDPDTDLLAALAGDDSIAWYENLGGGIFGARQNIAKLTVDGPTSVFAVDLDLDLDIDVLSSSFDDNTIAWYENLGGGDFGNPNLNQQIISSTAGGAQSVFAVDLDGDLDIDVLSASSNDAKISWYDNDGMTFTERILSSQSIGARSVVAADVDRDGDIDVVTAASISDTVEWLENTGPFCDADLLDQHDLRVGCPEEDAPCNCSADLECADACKDLCVEECMDSTEKNCLTDCEDDCDARECVTVFTSVPITTSADFVRGVLTADIDNDDDGLLDIVAVSSGDDSVAWHQQERVPFGKKGDFLVDFTERPTTSTAESARAIAVEDLNGDGALDIVTGFLFEVAWHQGNVAEACQNFDATGDGEMDGEEMGQIAGAFGQVCVDPGDPAAEWWFGVDYNADCQIDGTDLAILTSTGVWGHCIDAAIDEDDDCTEELQCSFTCP